MKWSNRGAGAGLRRLAAALALLAGCRDGTSPGTSGDINGVWDWTATRTIPQARAVCGDTGSFVFSRQGATFAGLVEFVGSCTTPSGPWSYRQTDSVTGGTISGDTVGFSLASLGNGTAYCGYAAVFAVSPVESLTGTGTCSTGTVTWHAERGGPISSVTATPAVALRIVGGSTTFSTELRTGAGTRGFLRPITWSSDQLTVATVSTDGVATAVGAGTATITATVENHSGSATLTVSAPAGLAAVGAGDARSCGLTAAGDAQCWGLMLGAFGGTPTPIGGGLHFTYLSMGHDFACGLVTGGAAYCFGANDSGQLGNGSTSGSATPVAVAGGLTFKSLSAGGRHACGVTPFGDAWCWGANSGGQLGDSSTTSSTVPVPVRGGINFFTITAGGRHTCAIRGVDSLAFCWGDNAFGQLGDSTTTRRLAPVRVAGGMVLSPLSAGAFHTCGVALPRTAYCWGSNGGGQLGTGNMQDSDHPVAVTGGVQLVSVSAGSIHSCAIGAAGAAWCWGTNSWGQLGNGTITNSTTPVAVSSGLRFLSLSAGLYSYSDEAINWTTAAHTCGVTFTGVYTTWCWGVNNVGQVGNGAAGFTEQRVPVKVAGQP